MEGEQSFSAVISGTTPPVNFNDTLEVVVTIEDTDSKSVEIICYSSTVYCALLIGFVSRDL